MPLMDALFYWLQMKWITDSRPDDGAARDTLAFFAQILTDDHALTSFAVASVEAGKVHVAYSQADGTARTVWFDLEAVEQLRRDMFGSPEATGDEGGFPAEEENE